jgi:hypothetical protein
MGAHGSRKRRLNWRLPRSVLSNLTGILGIAGLMAFLFWLYL